MNSFKIVGSHLCPNTLYAITKCKEAGLVFSFQDLSASLGDLKSFLALHEHDAVYASFREMSGREDYPTEGKIGLPCFVFADGHRTLDLKEAMEKAANE
ncbi:MAG: glutaredoxin [Enterocloster asparagiformis]|nr:glutaredoxin [Enterocloster asparagiformis]